MQNLKTDWTQYDIMKPADFNAICEAINERGECITQLQRENAQLREELAEKTAGKGWSIHGAFAELGIPVGEEAIHKIAEAMSDRSILFVSTNTLASGTADIYPANSGFLEVVKFDLARVMVTFRTGDGSSVWTGSYYWYRDEPWQGWRIVITE